MEYTERFPRVYDDEGNLLPNAFGFLPAISTSPVPEDSTNKKLPLKIHFFCPRPKQRTIAKGRDFYVIGSFSSDDPDYVIDENASLSVFVLTKDAFPKRIVTCEHKDDKGHLYLDDVDRVLPAELKTKKISKENRDKLLEIARNSCAPDLVYDWNDDSQPPRSLRYTWNKAYYTDVFFSALIYGGEYGTEEDHSNTNSILDEVYPYDQFDKKISPLDEGEYVILVRLTDSRGKVIAQNEINITIGNLPNKILSSVTEARHIAVISDYDKEDDAEKHKTIFWDPFPGMWLYALINNGDFVLRKGEPRPQFFFQPSRRRVNFNDACEYRGGTIHFYNYDIRNSSNALTVEFAEIFRQKKRNNDVKVIEYVYEAGQPTTFASDIDRIHCVKDVRFRSKWIDTNDYVKLTCVNIFKSEDLPEWKRDLIENDGIDQECEEKCYIQMRLPSERWLSPISIYTDDIVRVHGACMLPPQQDNFDTNELYACYNLNLITGIVYSIEVNGVEKDKQIVHPVGMGDNVKRKIGKWDSINDRCLEFKHVFTFPEEWYNRVIKISPYKAITKCGEEILLNTTSEAKLNNTITLTPSKRPRQVPGEKTSHALETMHNKKKILVFGSANIDKAYSVDHFVQKGETISADTLKVSVGGKGVNQAIAFARADNEVYFAGAVGGDGEAIFEVLADASVDSHLVKVLQEERSGHAIIQLTPDGQNSIIISPGTNYRIDHDYVNQVLSEFSEGDLVVLQNEIDCVDYIIAQAKEAGMLVALNPSPFNSRIRNYDLSMVDYLLINEVEGSLLTGFSDPLDVLEAVHSKYPYMSLVLTLGEKGAVFMSSDGEIFTCGIYDVVAVDTTGAGDTFTGYFLSEAISSGDYKLALENATIASGLSVTRRGASSSIPHYFEVTRADRNKLKEITVPIIKDVQR